VVNKDIANNQDLLRQTLAHEIIHHHLYQEYGNEVAKHGEHFSLLADRINKKEGENFVSQFADETDFKPNATASNVHQPKLLYHQTTKKNAEQIKNDGYISPKIGSVVQDAYGEDVTDPVVFMSSNRNKLGYYSLWHMEHDTNNKIKRENFTAEDLAKDGALILVDPQNEYNSIYFKPKDFDGRYVIDVKTGESVSYFRDGYDEKNVSDLPISIEDGDYFSIEPVEVYRVLIGDEYLDYLKKYSQHPVILKMLQKTMDVKGSLNIPEIKWSYPTDKELFNEIQTEHDIEKLLVEEMWPTKSHYQSAVDELKKVAAPEDLDPKKLKGRHIWNSYEDLVKTVKSFGGPKDPDSMLEAINSGKPLPMPIVIRKRNGELHVAGGATRSGIANLAGQKITALVIDEKKANERMADRHEKKGYQYVIDENAEHLWEGIKEYFFANGPKPEITKDEKFIAHLIGIRLEIIARLRGIDIKDKNNKWEEYIITSDFKTVERKFIDQGVANEDVKEYLDAFKKLRNTRDLGENKDIDKWGKKPFDNFKEFVDKTQKEKTKTEEKKLKKSEGAELVGEDENYTYYHIKKFELDTEEKQLAVVRKDSTILRYIQNPTEAVQLEAVKQNGYVIQYIKKPTEAVQLEAVKQNGYAVSQFTNPSEIVQIEAVKQKGDAIRYIQNPSISVQLEAVKQCGYAIEHIENPSGEVQLEAIKENIHAIFNIKNLSEAVQFAVIKKSPDLFRYIKEPTQKVLEYMKLK
jgi:hypothetical protein